MPGYLRSFGCGCCRMICRQTTVPQIMIRSHDAIETYGDHGHDFTLSQPWIDVSNMDCYFFGGYIMAKIDLWCFICLVLTTLVCCCATGPLLNWENGVATKLIHISGTWRFEWNMMKFTQVSWRCCRLLLFLWQCERKIFSKQMEAKRPTDMETTYVRPHVYISGANMFSWSIFGPLPCRAAWPLPHKCPEA